MATPRSRFSSLTSPSPPDLLGLRLNGEVKRVPRTYYAMQLDRPGAQLRRVERALPAPGKGEIGLVVTACGVCRTDLHIVDGDLKGALPIVPGHEIVGRVDALGAGVAGFPPSDRRGGPWRRERGGPCPHFAAGRGNLCPAPALTGFTRDGGFASYCIADAGFAFALPETFDDAHAAPLLCAGLIGYRAYRMAGDGARLGLYGFGAAAHILAQVAMAEGRKVYAFTREGDGAGQAFARRLGCVWAGASNEAPPAELDAAILFAPVGALVPEALRRVRKGGRVICAGIHMSDIPSFAYADLWEERSIASVANLTRADGAEFLALARRTRIETFTTVLPLADANQALDRLRRGEVTGALVLVP